MQTIDLLKELSNLPAISGREQPIADWLTTYTDRETTQDAFKNVYIGNIYSENRKVALWSHSDEVGFYVKSIRPDGFIRFEGLGNWWGHVVLGQRVQLTSRKTGQAYTGIVGTLPSVHHNKKEVVAIEDMYIDLGAENEQELTQIGIQPGDMITPLSLAQSTFNQRYLIGKALDNRVACAVIVKVLEKFKGQTITALGVSTAQEEVGTRGAEIAAKKIDADLNIVIDVANGKDTPNAAREPFRLLGKGPGLVLHDKTALASIEWLDFIRETAEINQLPYQYDHFSGGGTDAGAVQKANGNPTVVISIPVRYCHSWNSMVSIEDIETAIQLIGFVLERLEGGDSIE